MVIAIGSQNTSRTNILLMWSKHSFIVVYSIEYGLGADIKVKKCHRMAKL